VNQEYTVIENVNVCSGDDYTFPDETSLTNIISNNSHASILTSVTGCDSTITTNISVISLDISIIADGSTLTANETNADSYQWVDCDYNYSPINGKTNYTFTASESGNYAVIIESNSCVDTSACNSISISGIEDTESLVQSIWPNPTSGQINIRFVENNAPVEISIFDITGKILLQKEVAINETIFTTELPGERGVYYIKVKSNSNTATSLIIKK
jgi:hypothetical protein